MFLYLVNISLFILFRLLCLGWPFYILAVCHSSLLWRFLPVMGLDEWLVKVSWFGKLASVFWWVELDLFSLECNDVSSLEFWGVCGFGVTFGSLYFCDLGYVLVLLENELGMSCSDTCWLLGGAWFQCRYGSFWMSSCWLMFPGVRSFFVFSSFGFRPPASGFQSYSYSSLKTSPSIQHWW